MKTVTFTLRGKKYGLYYNGAAMFDVQDVLGGDTTQLFTVIRGRSREKFAKLCEMIEIMSAQYNKAMAAVGRPAPELLRAEYLHAVAALRDIDKLQNMVIEAINAGLAQEETEEDEEIDIGLIELQKKTAKAGLRERST